MKPVKNLGLVDMPRSLRTTLEHNAKVLSNISFGTTTSNTDEEMNMQCWKSTGTSPAGPNTEFAVSHNLGRIPIGFMVASTNKAGHLYKSTTAWTATNIYLKADVASLAYTIVII
jgi:hypothetical protein